jgi:hypothetical protein
MQRVFCSDSQGGFFAHDRSSVLALVDVVIVFPVGFQAVYSDDRRRCALART